MQSYVFIMYRPMHHLKSQVYSKETGTTHGPIVENIVKYIVNYRHTEPKCCCKKGQFHVYQTNLRGAHPEERALPLDDRDNDQEQPGDDRSLAAKRLESTVFRRPRNLEVRDGEAAESTEEVDKGGVFTLEGGEAVVHVGVWIESN